MQAALDCFVALLLAMTSEQKRGRYSAAAVCARHHGGSEPEKRHTPSYEGVDGSGNIRLPAMTVVEMMFS